MVFKIFVSNFVINDKNQFLMVREKKEKCFGKYNFPGGHLNFGEKLVSGAMRELQEEVSLNLSSKNLLKIFTAYDGQNHFIQFVFLVESNELSPFANENEILSCEWIDMNEFQKMDKNLFLHHQKVLECINAFKNKDSAKISIISEM